MKLNHKNDILNDRFRSNTVLSLLLLVFIRSLASASFGSALERVPHLRAYSLSAARKAITSSSGNPDEICFSGMISKVWAVMLDDDNGLIIIGEADPSIPSIHLDDIAVALRTIDKISTGENPGVSIEPSSFNKYSPFQMVVYYGGIDSTHYGKICYEADLLLKRLALDFELTGIVGFPNEWDLSLNNAKSGRRLNPWERSVGRSWFFPYRVRIAHMYNCASVTAVTMEVRTDLEKELELPREFISLDNTEITKILKSNREGVSVIFARLFTQHYEEIASRFPILIQLQNLLSLSGLLAELLKNDTMKDLSYWKDEFPVKNVANPTKTPTLSKGVNGLGHSLFMSGGVFVDYSTEDAWTDAVLSRKPKYLKQAALASRPSSTAVSWTLPLGYGPPNDWTDSLVHALQQVKPLNQPGETEHNYKLHLENPILNMQTGTPGWRPVSIGRNLMAFKAHLYFSSGGFEAFSPDGRFSVAGAEISTGIPLNFQIVLANRFDLSLTIPLIFRTQFEDRPSRLPGLKDNLIAFASGIENPILANRIQLVSGVRNGRWIFPSVVAENSIVLPTNYRIFEESIGEADSGDPLSARFGSDDWRGSHGLSVFAPVVHSLSISGLGEFQTNWNGSMSGDRIVTGGAINWLFERDAGLSLGLHYRTSSVREKINPLLDGEGKSLWINEGHQFFVSMSFPTRSGTNSIFIGWFSPRNKPNLGGTFLMSIDLGGTSLWDKRTWF